MATRMTAQSKVNIKAASDAKLIPTGTGYKVELIGKSNTAFVENAAGAIVYSSMAVAKTAIRTHNSTLNPELKPSI